MSKREEVISQLEALAYCYKTKCADCKYSGRIPVALGKYKTCRLPDDDEILEAAIELLKKEEKQTAKVDIRNVAGLWCDDITFCQEDCDWVGCPRNAKNIRDNSVPHSFFIGLPPDCPKLIGMVSADA